MREAPPKIKDGTNYSEAFFEKVSLVIQILSFSHLIQMKYIFKVFYYCFIFLFQLLRNVYAEQQL